MDRSQIRRIVSSDANRILRRFPDHHNRFMQVSFTDDEHLQFRFDHRKVDGPGFIDKLVGTTLRDGFELCGRKFDFLAYSQLLSRSIQCGSSVRVMGSRPTHYVSTYSCLLYLSLVSCLNWQRPAHLSRTFSRIFVHNGGAVP